MTTPRRGRLVAVPIVALAIALLATTASCSQEDRPVPTQAEIDARPTLPDTLARYDRMQEQVRAAVDTAMGAQDWIRRDDRRSQGTCGAGVRGTTVTMPSWQFKAPITDTHWPAVKNAVLTTIAGYGFQPGGMAVDQGPRHELNAYDPTLGAQFNLGDDAATVMQVTTGCHPEGG